MITMKYRLLEEFVMQQRHKFLNRKQEVVIMEFGLGILLMSIVAFAFCNNHRGYPVENHIDRDPTNTSRILDGFHTL